MTTHSITHPELVTALVKPPQDIINTLTIFTVDLWHGATGVSGEAGELLEAILFPREGGIDRVNLREELGDLYFYIEQIVQRTGIVISYDTAVQIADEADMRAKLALHYAASIAVHGSQVLDTVKKAALYNKQIDLELLTNQLNALVASMLSLGRMFHLERDECLSANIRKLSKRYESLSYSDKAAQDRADKQTGADEVVPSRKPFKGEEDTRAHTPGVTEPMSPRTSDMQDIADASKGS